MASQRFLTGLAWCVPYISADGQPWPPYLLRRQPIHLASDLTKMTQPRKPIAKATLNASAVLAHLLIKGSIA